MPTTEADERILMQKVAAGDSAARQQLIELHGPSVMRLVRYLAGAAQTLAEDIFQETFGAVFRSASTFDPEAGPLRSWLFAIARHQLRALQRQRTYELVSEPSELALGSAAGFGAHEPDAQWSAAEQRVLLAQALATLSSEEREVLLLRDLENMPGEHAAQLLGLGLAAMKSRLHRARLRLMAAYRRQEAGVTASEKTVAGLRCRDVLAQLSGYVDGELAAAERARIDAHLRGCSVCERFGGRFSATVHTLREALGADLAVDAALVTGLRARLEHA